jgi:LPXTG-site transpeptidase (sortase) family protein
MRKSVERVFWAIAVIGIGLYALSVAEARLYQSYLDWQFAKTLQPPILLAAGIPPSEAAHKPAKAKPAEGQPLARLEIPAIHLSAMVSEGVQTSTLRRSIGHIPGTALPGEKGNVGLSAHRDTFFRHLGRLQKGDRLTLKTTGVSFDYIVESTGVINPDESGVLRNIGRPTLTLVTCFPFYYVGPAPKRFIVHASMLD